ncbi:hypothetical protein [Geodermatophilus sp. URMC 62]|uniref:hypothetical protein n=1 Tax=Geodermatophilus sp. URMC 62 TaxID=3423414 RepID=UPI00406C4186
MRPARAGTGPAGALPALTACSGSVTGSASSVPGGTGGAPGGAAGGVSTTTCDRVGVRSGNP